MCLARLGHTAQTINIELKDPSPTSISLSACSERRCEPGPSVARHLKEQQKMLEELDEASRARDGVVLPLAESVEALD